MIQALHTSHPYCNQLHILLVHIINSGIRTRQLTEMAYEWCSLEWEDHPFIGSKHPLLLSLEIGFHHVVPDQWIEYGLIHTEHHQQLANIAFSSGDGDAVADLLCAWTSKSSYTDSYPSLGTCAEYLIDLHSLHPFSQRLRQYIIYAVVLIGYEPFEQAGLEGFVGLLNDLQVYTEHTEHAGKWAMILLDTIQSSEGIKDLSLTYYEWLVDLAASWYYMMRLNAYNPGIMVSLEKAGEWDKLMCWVAVVWMVWPPWDGKTTEEDLEHTMLSLFHQQPDSIQMLERKLGSWGRSESFQRISKWVCEQAQQTAQ